MKSNRAPSIADILFLVVAPLTAITRTVKLTHSDGDLAAHIRMGQVILETRQIPPHSLASFTASNEPLIAHAWLSEVIFAALFSVGGLAILSVVTGIIVAATHASIALFLRARGVDPRWALAAALISLAVGSTHWLARPHMFSILGVALTLYLLESGSRGRLPLIALLFAVWANLHGGWLYGLMMIALYVAGSAIEAGWAAGRRAEWLKEVRSHSAAFLVAGAATLLNPYGLGLHAEVVSGAVSPTLAGQMGEFMSPDFQALAPLPFLLALLLSVALLATTTRRLSAPHLLLVGISLLLALRSFRNMALFGVTAWPIIALHVARAWPERGRRFRWFTEIARLDKTTRPGLYALPIAIVLLIVGLNRGRVFGEQLIREDFSPRKFPSAAVAGLRAAGLDQDRIFEPWEWGGYIMYSWPSARLAVDPLKFNDSTTHMYSIIDAVQPGWQDEIARWDIRTVIVHPDSRLARGLEREPGWAKWYSDSTAVVFRPASD
ncbi:MAG: hypothetical protein ACR2GK_00070 [Gemmatimonadaceae bacterium]